MSLQTLYEIVQVVIPVTALFFAPLAWMGKRFVEQLDKLADSVNNLATTVAALQAEQKVIWKRLDTMEERG